MKNILISSVIVLVLLVLIYNGGKATMDIHVRNQSYPGPSDNIEMTQSVDLLSI